MTRGRDELEELRPYLELAREIRAEVEQIASAGPESSPGLDAALDAVPQRERERTARAVFQRLPVEQQWAVIERVFGDEEIRSFLADARAARLDEVERRAGDVAAARVARGARRLEVATLRAGTIVTMGMFRPAEVRAAVRRGHSSSSCARQLVVRATGGGDGGLVHVLDDVFNPDRSFFVAPDYDEEVWAGEALPGHELVRMGSSTSTSTDRTVEPVLYPGGRVDVEVDGEVRIGRLHLGYVLIEDEDVFAVST